jgi:prepilin-type N-terminal cleavage/methylation domain-containing protein
MSIDGKICAGHGFKRQKTMRNNTGFTLIEIIAVLALLSLLSAVAIPRYIDVEQNAVQRAIDSAIAELNGRESLVWANLKISTFEYQDDDQLVLSVDYNLGADYFWKPGHPVSAGGDLTFGGETVALNRIPSNISKPAFWRR